MSAVLPIVINLIRNRKHLRPFFVSVGNSRVFELETINI